MLAIAFVAVAVAGVTGLSFCLSGHVLLAFALAPLAGSVGGLAAAIAIALFAPADGPMRSGSAEIRAAIGAGLRKMYGGIAQEPLPERLARMAAKLEQR